MNSKKREGVIGLFERIHVFFYFVCGISFALAFVGSIVCKINDIPYNFVFLIISLSSGAYIVLMPGSYQDIDNFLGMFEGDK